MKMKKFLLLIIIILLTIFVFFRIGKKTGIIQSLQMTSSSSEPNIELNKFVFGTNIGKPEKLDFVFFNSEFSKYGQGIWVFRLCAIENDTIEIINGDAFVNHENIDHKLNLKHAYIVGNKQLRKLNIKNTDIYKKDKDSSIVFILTIMHKYQIM